MATNGSFVTGGGYPEPGSPPTPVPFTIEWIRVPDLLSPSGFSYKYNFHTDPQHSPYICALFENPQDIAGRNSLIENLGAALHAESNLPEYTDPSSKYNNPSHPEYVSDFVPPIGLQPVEAAANAAVAVSPPFTLPDGSLIAGGFIYRSCRIAQQFDPDAEIDIKFAEDPSDKSFETVMKDPSSGEVLADIAGDAEGGHLIRYHDVNDGQVWSEHTVAFDSTGRVIGDVYDYDTADIWSATHFLPANLT